MIRTQASTTIDRPLADVFTFIAESPANPAWDSDILELIRRGTGPTALGSEFTSRIKPFMGQSEGSFQVTKFESDRHLELRGRLGPMEPAIRFWFAPSGAGTELRREIEMQPTGLMRLLEPLIRRSVAKRNEAILDELKRVVETRRG